MISRILPKDEWHRLGDLPITELIDFVKPEDVRVVVVECEDKIVATMTVLRMTHLEGTWVSEDHRNAGVVRSLLRAAAKASADWAPGWVVTSANSAEIKAILARMQALEVQADPYILNLGGN